MKKTLVLILAALGPLSTIAAENIEDKFPDDHMYHLASAEILKKELAKLPGATHFLEKTEWLDTLWGTEQAKSGVALSFSYALYNYGHSLAKDMEPRQIKMLLFFLEQMENDVVKAILKAK